MDPIANWIVKQEIEHNHEWVRDSKTYRCREVYLPTSCDFTLDTALRSILGEPCYEREVEDLLLHNVVLRNAMRESGVSIVIGRIKEFAPPQLHQTLDAFVEHYPDGSIANMDIQVYSILDDVQILGQTFHGLEDIVAYEDIALHGYYKYTDEARCEQPQKRGDVHVGRLWVRYPCFDAEDYANEDRTFQTYIIRNQPITNDDMQRIKALPSCDGYGCVHELLPMDMLPIVYYRGDGGFMLVATAR